MRPVFQYHCIGIGHGIGSGRRTGRHNDVVCNRTGKATGIGRCWMKIIRGSSRTDLYGKTIRISVDGWGWWETAVRVSGGNCDHIDTGNGQAIFRYCSYAGVGCGIINGGSVYQSGLGRPRRNIAGREIDIERGRLDSGKKQEKRQALKHNESRISAICISYWIKARLLSSI